MLQKVIYVRDFVTTMLNITNRETLGHGEELVAEAKSDHVILRHLKVNCGRHRRDWRYRIRSPGVLQAKLNG